MRKQYNIILLQFFYEQLIHSQHERDLMQAQMAGILSMDERSYVNLDYGESGCSCLTLVCFLVYCCDDPKTFLSSCALPSSRGDDVA